ncbi:MAG: hypothetical protein KF730_10400 [Sphingomonas sp.]|uniref:hypothetical protein n=1 Tax=Sphingomonas sp. TaxID=28214 RepID=UPI0025E27AE6|nr:hypothetical protein [Sphingomonas sp.]MBX3564973.1 hypothetical protein [Sphingomonas sp.]
MHDRGTAIGTIKQLRLFAASLWLTLATALFCAVMPAGLPGSVTHGSAFSSANHAVALHASSSSNRAMLKRGVKGDPAAPSAGSEVIAPAGVPAIVAPSALASPPASLKLAALPISGIPEARYPRGPPAA